MSYFDVILRPLSYVPTVAYYACCAITSLMYAILCLPGCHVMPTMSYKSCSIYCGLLCLLILCLFSRVSNRFKYWFGFRCSSCSKYFSGSGLVWVHLSTIFEVQVWFRFSQVKYYWFRFNSGSLTKNLTVVTRFVQKKKSVQQVNIKPISHLPKHLFHLCLPLFHLLTDSGAETQGGWGDISPNLTVSPPII